MVVVRVLHLAGCAGSAGRGTGPVDTAALSVQSLDGTGAARCGAGDLSSPDG